MFDNDALVIQHTLSSWNKCIFIQWMNTLIIAEAMLIIKGDATVQLRISAVLLRKPGRWDVPYALYAVSEFFIDFIITEELYAHADWIFLCWEIINPENWKSEFRYSEITFLCLMNYAFPLGYWSRPCCICGA